MKVWWLVLGIALMVAGCSSPKPLNFVVLYDMTGSEAQRLPELKTFLIRTANPRTRGLLYDGDTFTVIPIRAPRKGDTTYPVLVHGTYEEGSRALERQLQTVLPDKVDTEWGTDLSLAIRSAASVLRRQDGERVLIISGPGEDHADHPVTPAEVGSALAGTLVILLNAGEPYAGRWAAFFGATGVRALLTYDAATTRDLYAGPDRLRDRINTTLFGRR